MRRAATCAMRRRFCASRAPKTWERGARFTTSEKLVADVLRGAPRHRCHEAVAASARGRKLGEEELAHAASVVAQARVGVDAHADHAFRRLNRLFRNAFQRLLHE